MERHQPHRPGPYGRLVLWLAQGLGVGRSRLAPGTLGSVLGLVWFALLLWSGQPWLFMLGTGLGLAVAVPVCAAAETMLGAKDPPSVVLDEIAAVPLCFAPLLADQGRQHGFPGLSAFLLAWPWWTVLAVFLIFRCLDIMKPWPVRQSQRLRGGWGIVLDDLLAAAWVNVILTAALLVR